MLNLSVQPSISTITPCRKKPKSLIPKGGRAFPSDFFSIETPLQSELDISRSICDPKVGNQHCMSPMDPGLVLQQKFFPQEDNLNKQHNPDESTEITFRVKRELGRGQRANSVNPQRRFSRPISAIYGNQSRNFARIGSEDWFIRMNRRSSDAQRIRAVWQELEDINVTNSICRVPPKDANTECGGALKEENTALSLVKQPETHENELVSFRSIQFLIFLNLRSIF